MRGLAKQAVLMAAGIVQPGISYANGVYTLSQYTFGAPITWERDDVTISGQTGFNFTSSAEAGKGIRAKQVVNGDSYYSNVIVVDYDALYYNGTFAAGSGTRLGGASNGAAGFDGWTATYGFPVPNSSFEAASLTGAGLWRTRTATSSTWFHGTNGNPRHEVEFTYSRKKADLTTAPGGGSGVSSQRELYILYTDANNYVRLFLQGNSATITKRVAGVNGSTMTTSGTTFAHGDVIRLKRVSAGSSTYLQLLKNGVRVDTSGGNGYDITDVPNANTVALKDIGQGDADITSYPYENFSSLKIYNYQSTSVSISSSLVDNIAGVNRLILSGSYSSAITTLEMLVLDGSGRELLPWADMIGPGAGAFSSVVSGDIPDGTVGPVRFYVRDKADPTVFATGAASVPLSLATIDYGRTIGLNLTTTSYFGGQYIYANLGKYSNWVRQGPGGSLREDDPTYANALGDIIAMRAGESGYEMLVPTIKFTTYRIRITWTGEGAYSSFFANGSETVSVISSAANDVTLQIIPGSDPKFVGIRFGYTSSANPIIGLDIREVDNAGVSIDPGKWRQEWLDYIEPAGALRFLGTGAGNVGSPKSIVRVTAAQRTLPECRYPNGAYTQAKYTHGSGASGLIFAARDQSANAPYDISYTKSDMLARVGAAVGFKHPFGADGNLITVTILTASGAGSVTYDVSGSTYDVIITPATGATTASQIQAQVKASDAHYFITAVLTGDGSGAVTTLAKTSLTGGKDPINMAGIPVEDYVDMCNQANADMHVPLPIFFADDWYDHFFTYVRDNLNTNLRLYIELGNEHWNFAAPYSYDITTLASIGELHGGTTGQTNAFNGPYGYAYRYRQVVAQAETIFAGQLSRIIRIGTGIQTVSGGTDHISNFFSNPASLRYIADKVDTIAIAPYFQMFHFIDTVAWASGQSYGKYKPVYDVGTTKVYFAPAAYTSGATAAADIAAGNLLELTAENCDSFMMSELSDNMAIAATLKSAAALYTNDKGLPIDAMYYEGSQGNAIDLPGLSTTEPYLTQIRTFWRHALQRKWESAYHGETLRRVSRSATRMAFNALNGTFGWNHNGQWGLSEFMSSADMDRPRYVALKDARDGKFQVYYAHGESPTVIGARMVGIVLTCDARPRWATSISYQWRRGSTPISGATSRTYMQISADIGSNVNCEVTASNPVSSLSYMAGTSGGVTA
jgi:hypothetical protein